MWNETVRRVGVGLAQLERFASEWSNVHLSLMNSPDTEDRVLVSYLTLRRVVGLLGVTLPALLALGTWALTGDSGPKSSISSYYDSPMRDVLVGSLFGIGLFLFSYRGYERRDDIAGDLACLFAVAVALAPTTSLNPLIRTTHLLAAVALFSTLAYFSLFLFTKSKPSVPTTREKRTRNRIYIYCGLLMLGAMVGIGLHLTGWLPAALSPFHPVFWLESVALWAFGVSWFVKGQTFWQDKPRA